LELGAYGVHIGQDDLPGTDLVALQKAGLCLGLSTHNYAELARALQVIPSYVAIGTLFHSPSKTFTHNPLGIESFRRMKPLAGVPVVAIGGITLALAGEVEAAGADGLAVISDVLAAPDPAGRVREWRSRAPKIGPSSP
jgi:thiamine-phosphate diphosphorylase